MNEKKQVNTPSGSSLFGKENYTGILSGSVVICIGMFLMSGGESKDPAQFDPKDVYSTTRITIAPIIILLGLAIEIFAIFRKPKA